MNKTHDNTVSKLKHFTDHEYEIDPLVTMFPAMSAIEFEALKEDIKLNGLLEPIVLYQGRVVDGRHRLLACRELGVNPMFISVDADSIKGTIDDYVISRNLHRRQLAMGQRAMIAANLATLVLGDNQHTAHAVSQSEAAKLLGVSVDSLQRAKKVRACGHLGLIEAVENNKIDVTRAVRLAELDKAALDKVLAIDDLSRIFKDKGASCDDSKKDAAASHWDTSIGKFGVVLVNPFGDISRAQTDSYFSCKTAEYCAIPVKDVTEDAAAVFMWITPSRLLDGLTIMETWGFRYRSHAVMTGTKKQPGRYFDERHALLLIGTKGGFSIVKGKDSVIEDDLDSLIEFMCKGVSVLEISVPEKGQREWFVRGQKNASAVQAGEGQTAEVEGDEMEDGEDSEDQYSETAISVEDAQGKSREGE
ncbi:Transcriptional activator%2C adenine-specific DNA methyltransferase [Burkholderia pseudomallei]|uniref:Spo0J and IME4 domain-containing protein n=1 Tax=Burkholderia pseudomallei TaxID=28450 RepID=UPI0005DFEFB4|nr:ParB N-terminal domain-containing protein [Burkholderia pseudomallei]CFK64675.1 Transcriptional activator%2C adenine-specific DNA methyltransferase [Burkholderia pseudomallei]CPF87351.1 Transcriptional activator%2C adenine-specific DNA methyltransferase [Burkholderia pseudomallei]CPG42024.1 Transcriptional activator%2C adenine-specific DNA methyltransferase [Burkholderia pseudomallei]